MNDTFLNAKGLVIALDASRTTVAAASKDNLRSIVVIADVDVATDTVVLGNRLGGEQGQREHHGDAKALHGERWG